MENTLKYKNLIVDEKLTKMELREFLSCQGFDPSKYTIELDFWFQLHSVSDDVFIELTDELIDLVGFKSSESNKSSYRSHLITFIRKNFKENEDFLANFEKLAKTGRGGAHHKLKIEIKKQSFKELLLLVHTEKSKMIHKYLLDLEHYTREYVLYQTECRMYELHCERVIKPADTVPITGISKAVYLLDLVDQPY
jgi:phage anti-repressor protein